MPKKTDKPIGYSRPDAIDLAVENLVAVCGFSNSYRDSEQFFLLLIEAIDVLSETPEPHDDKGLPYDMTHSLASVLRELIQNRSETN